MRGHGWLEVSAAGAKYQGGGFLSLGERERERCGGDRGEGRKRIREGGGRRFDREGTMCGGNRESRAYDVVGSNVARAAGRSFHRRAVYKCFPIKFNSLTLFAIAVYYKEFVNN